MSTKGRGEERFRYWSAGQRVNSAARLNQAMRAIDRRNAGTFSTPAGQTAYGRMRFGYIEAIETAPAVLGHIVVEWALGEADGAECLLWPELYRGAGTEYTYTDNNNRTHIASSTAQVLTPPLKVGELLRLEFVYDPASEEEYWMDTNRVARQWAEVPT